MTGKLVNELLTSQISTCIAQILENTAVIDTTIRLHRIPQPIIVDIPAESNQSLMFCIKNTYL